MLRDENVQWMNMEALEIGVLCFGSDYSLKFINTCAKQYLHLTEGPLSSEEVLYRLQFQDVKNQTLPFTYRVKPQDLQVTVSSFSNGTDMLFIVYPDTTCVPHDLVFALDADYAITQVQGDPLQRHLRLPLDQVVGRKFPDFFSEETSSHIQSALERARDTKSRQEFQYHSPVTGDIRYFHASITFEKDSFLVGVDDISAQLKVSSAQGTILLDSAFHIVSIDHTGCTLLACDSDGMLGLDIRSVFAYEVCEGQALVACDRNTQVMKRFWISTSLLPHNGGEYWLVQFSEWQSNPPQAYSLELNNILLQFSYELLKGPLSGMPELLQHILATLGISSGSDRAYIFQCEAHWGVSNTYEWCAPGISSEKNQLQGLPCTAFPQWIKTLEQGQEIHICQVKDLPDSWQAERATLIAQHIQSILVEPIMVDRQLLGFLGFDSVVAAKQWPAEVRRLLRFFAQLLGSYFSHVRSEHALQQALEATKNLAGEREQQNLRLNALYARNSHDIRNSLSAITGMADLLQQTTLDKKQSTYVSQIRTSSFHVTHLIQDLLDFSLLSHQQPMLRGEAFSIQDVVAAAVDSVALFAGEKHLQLSYEVESVIPHQVAGDSVRLTQVLINLLHNAVKFTEVGEVSIRVSLLDLRADTATVGMVVSDTGVGMTEQMVSRLFSAELNASSGGYGLGLGIVKQLVSAMGGRLEIESEVGRGSHFTCTITFKLPEYGSAVRLPRGRYGYVGKASPSSASLLERLQALDVDIARYDSASDALSSHCMYLLLDTDDGGVLPGPMDVKPRGLLLGTCFNRGTLALYAPSVEVLGFVLHGAATSTLAAEMKAKLSSHAALRTHVLVVDDSAIHRELLHRKLSELQVKATLAASGEAALQLLEGHRFDLVFMDLHLPGLDGIETALAMLKMQPKLEIIALSATLDAAVQKRCEKAGIKRVMLKPLEDAELRMLL